MKKTKIIAKKQILTFAMVLALGAAVWLNVKFATNGSDTKSTGSISDAQLGSAKYVANTGVADSSDFFTKTKKERADTREEELEIIKDTLNSQKATEKQKQAATEQTKAITERMEKESAIESLLNAKGFSSAAAILGDNSCNVIVKKEKELEKSETIQILDIVMGETQLKAENIKIVAVK